jgi:hypothetical protein
MPLFFRADQNPRRPSLTIKGRWSQLRFVILPKKQQLATPLSILQSAVK